MYSFRRGEVDLVCDAVSVASEASAGTVADNNQNSASQDSVAATLDEKVEEGNDPLSGAKRKVKKSRRY